MKKICALLLVSLVSFPCVVYAKASIVFLTKQEASRAITDDTGEPYFSTLQPMEMAAKTGSVLTREGLSAQRQETRERYRAATLDFSSQEKASITTLVQGIDRGMKGRYPKITDLPWKFLKVEDSIEGGLPHTRGAYVVISKGVAAQLVELESGYPKEQAVAIGAGILLHEHLHVLQRENPKLFSGLYTNVWGFVHVPPFGNNAWLKVHHLANPDGLDCCWLFPLDKSKTNFILPDVVFADGDYLKRMPQDFQMVALQVRKNGSNYNLVVDAEGRPEQTPLMRVGSYVGVFRISGNIYHPNEASADMITQLVQYTLLSDLSRAPEKDRVIIENALAPVKSWADANL